MEGRKLFKDILGKKRLTVDVFYEIKLDKVEKEELIKLNYEIEMPKKQLKRRVKEAKRFIKQLDRMQKSGWNIDDVEVQVE